MRSCFVRKHPSLSFRPLSLPHPPLVTIHIQLFSEDRSFSYSLFLQGSQKPQRNQFGTNYGLLPPASTGLDWRAVPRFGKYSSCCCLPLLPQFACSILATWERPFGRALYIQENRVGRSDQLKSLTVIISKAKVADGFGRWRN